MNLTWLLVSMVVAVVVTSSTDWFFSGVLFHDKYLLYPETWRGAAGEAETNRILWTTLPTVVTCAAFIWVAVRLGLTSPVHTLKLAFAIWVIGALPLNFTNAIWIKMHPLTALAHTLGWLVKLVVCALCVAFVYGWR
jgi:hypothetical protein